MDEIFVKTTLLKILSEEKQPPLDLQFPPIKFKGSMDYYVSDIPFITSGELDAPKVVVVLAYMLKPYIPVLKDKNFAFGLLGQYSSKTPKGFICTTYNYFYFSENGRLLMVKWISHDYRYAASVSVMSVENREGFELCSLFDYPPQECMFPREKVLEKGSHLLDSLGLKGFPLK